MEIEFDDAKDAVNRRKHGLSLADAASMDLDTAFVVPDERRVYGEAQFQAFGLIDGRLHVLAVHDARRDAAGDLAAQGEFERGEAPWRGMIQIESTMSTIPN